MRHEQTGERLAQLKQPFDGRSERTFGGSPTLTHLVPTEHRDNTATDALNPLHSAVELTLLLGRVVVLVVVQAEGLLNVLDERARLGCGTYIHQMLR